MDGNKTLNKEPESRGITKYPNLVEMYRYHPYSDCAMCDHARIEPELLDAVLYEGEELEPVEIFRLARLYECNAKVLGHISGISTAGRKV